MKLTITNTKHGIITSGKYEDGIEFVKMDKPDGFDEIYPTILADVTETVNAMPGMLNRIAVDKFFARQEAMAKGKLMTSKYDGVDAATGQEFTAGTKIYYHNRNCYIA